MSRRSKPLTAAKRDGASQARRRLAALAPDYARVDERGHGELLAFARAYARELRFFDLEDRAVGDWRGFLEAEGVALADIVAYLDDPAAVDAQQAAWLGRPHLVLFLTFLKLLGHARDQLNTLTERHLEHYYGEVLGLGRRPADPDRAAVLIGLAPSVSRFRLPAGTTFQAGPDSAGVPQIYRSEHDFDANLARIAELRSVFVDLEITSLENLARSRGLAEPERFTAMLNLALGEPRPGDPVPALGKAEVDVDYVAARSGLVGFAKQTMALEHHELRTIMRLRERRGDKADPEWARINTLLGVADPKDPRDFDANLEAVAGKLDYDGLPQVESIDDLYDHRDREDCAAFITAKLPFARANFEALMRIKLRIDGEWAEINRLLERAGRRRRKTLSFDLESASKRFDPTGFDSNFQTAMGRPWPLKWPDGSKNLDQYFARVQELEGHLATSAEWLVRMTAIAGRAKAQTCEDKDWEVLTQLLREANRERTLADRRALIAGDRRDAGAGEGTAALLRSACFVLDLDVGAGQPPSWSSLLGRLGEYLQPAQVELLDRFHGQLADVDAAQLLSWSDADRILELAWRQREGLDLQPPELVAWHNLYAHADATAVTVDSGSDTPHWKTFGQRRPAADPAVVPAAQIGVALRSPLLDLRAGDRKLIVTLGFETEGFDLQRIDDAVEANALAVEISTAKGWVELDFHTYQTVTGAPGSDYASLSGGPRLPDEDRPALQLELQAEETVDPFAPLPGSGERWPTLRLMLRQQWDQASASYRARYDAFAGLHLTAVHLQVEVDALGDLRLRNDERRLDPKKPFEPFGRTPAAGSRLYFSHPELVRGRLERLELAIEWMGLPDDLIAHYTNYGKFAALDAFTASLSMVDQSLPLALLPSVALFEAGDEDEGKDKGKATSVARTMTVVDVPAALGSASVGFGYGARLDVAETGDVREDPRYFVLELGPGDFGHGDYPVIANRKSRALAAAIARGDDLSTDAKLAAYEVNGPYTPKIKQLRARYVASVELRFDGLANLGQTGADELIHIHPFGVCPAPKRVETALGRRGPRLLPDYGDAGELYIGLERVEAPQRLAMLVQLVDGSANPDRVAPTLRWSALDGDRWRSLEDGHLLADGTRGLINSGIVELELPAVAASTRMPADRYWLRVAIDRNPDSVCDALALHTQAVEVVFVDRGNADDHYAEPLPVASIDRLQQPRAEVSKVAQPYTSYGGRPRERAEHFHTRVSERLRHKQRALTPWDYEHLVLEAFPAIYKAKCLRASDAVGGGPAGELGRARVVVVPDIRHQLPRDPFAPKAPTSLLAEIEAMLRSRAPDHVRVEVRNPQYIAVMVRLGVRFVADVDEGWASRQLIADLNRFLSPWAYDEGAELSIGGRIYGNSIIDFVDRRDYIDYVAQIKLFYSYDGVDFILVPDGSGGGGEGYFVGTEHDDQILVAAREHQIDIIPERYQQAAFTGLEYMKVDLDFIVG